MYPTKIEEDYITRNLLNVGEKLPDSVKEMSFRQLNLFDDVNFYKEDLREKKRRIPAFEQAAL